MKAIEEMEFHPITEKIVDLLCAKTQNPNRQYFRVAVAYYFAVVASMMRASINTHDRGEIPVNIYALNLGTSGSGKGYSTNILETEVIHRFRERFLRETFPKMVERNLPKLAVERANQKNAVKSPNSPLVDPDEELERVRREFTTGGTVVFNYDSATTPAVKQLRHLLLMANAGSLNLQIDEIGSNLLASTEVLTAYLELYDKGFIKGKLIKNTADSIRSEEIEGGTPANMMMFGTPSKLLNGSKQEEEFYSMLDTGYARRCIFGWSKYGRASINLSPQEIYKMQTNKANGEFLEELSYHIAELADIDYMNKHLSMTEETAIAVIEYKQQCEHLSEALPEHEEIKKAELDHRYFKTLKLAGAYAFIDGSDELTMEHLENAIKLVEESGQAFHAILTRDKPYVKLAKYFASCKEDVTHTDLMEKLPFFKGTTSQRQELLTLAIAWGYRNNIIIKKSFADGIEFLRGEALKETSLDSMILSYSTDITVNYNNERVAFDQLHELTQSNGHHWTAHHLRPNPLSDDPNYDKSLGYRSEDKCIPGFNLIVIDVDEGVDIRTVQLLMKEYTYHLYTTKRHTEEENRFRIVFPANYELHMTAEEYKEFMSNIYAWLPFKCDEETNQRSRKWLSWNMHYVYNEGVTLDILPFIPKTSKNEERKKKLESQQDLDNVQRWMLNNTGDGNRNKMLLRYALILVDSGKPFDVVHEMVIQMNNKLPDKLDMTELSSTILKTVANKMTSKS